MKQASQRAPRSATRIKLCLLPLISDFVLPSPAGNNRSICAKAKQSFHQFAFFMFPHSLFFDASLESLKNPGHKVLRRRRPIEKHPLGSSFI